MTELETTGDAVIQEIVAEIDSGDAHLMTRNELNEFIHWIADGEKSGEFADAMYDGPLNSKDPVLSEDFTQALAKEWFVHEGYE